MKLTHLLAIYKKPSFFRYFRTHIMGIASGDLKLLDSTNSGTENPNPLSAQSFSHVFALKGAPEARLYSRGLVGSEFDCHPEVPGSTPALGYLVLPFSKTLLPHILEV